MIKYNLVNALAIDNINLLKILKDTDLQLDGFFFVCVSSFFSEILISESPYNVKMHRKSYFPY